MFCVSSVICFLDDKEKLVVFVVYVLCILLLLLCVFFFIQYFIGNIFYQVENLVIASDFIKIN